MSLADPNVVYLDERRRSRDVKDLNAEELFITESKQSELFSEKSQKYKDILIDESNLYKPDDETSTSPSCLRMLIAHKKINEQWPVSALLPRGCHLYESLAVDQKWNPTWTQPILNKQLDPNCMEHIAVNLAAYDKIEYNKIILPFIEAQDHQKKLYLNSNLQPFMVQTIEIPAEAYEKMKVGLKNKDEYVTIECPADITNPVEVPIGLSLSDGSTTTLTFRFPWYKKPIQSKDAFKPPVQTFNYVYTDMHQQFKTHFNSLNTLYAENAHHQINVLITFLQDFYQFKPNIKVVDIGAIAIAAGCRMDCVNLFSLSILCTYVIFPPDLDNMDQRWGWNVEDQPKAIRDYQEIKFKTLVSIYEILTGMLLRNLFPEPDIVLYALRMTQTTFIPWFCDFVAEALCDTRIHADPDHKPVHYQMKSRAEMVQSIKKGPNFLLDQLTDLYINVPVVACGGARYLHSTRHAFFNQFSVIEKINLSGYMGEQPRPRNDLLDRKYTLMFNRDYAIDDSGTPTDDVGLRANPQFVASLYNLDVASASTDDIKDLKPQNNRPISPAVMEWCRLNVMKMHSFFFKLNKLSVADLVNFWAERVCIYDYARGLAGRVTNRNLRVRSLDLLLANREDNVVKQMEKSLLRNAESLTESRRLNLLKDKIDAETDERNGLQGVVYKEIPGSNTEKNRQKNDYRKRKRRQFYQENPWAATPREHLKTKRLRVLGAVEAIIDPAEASPRELVIHSTPNSKGMRVNFESDSRSVSGSNSRGHSSVDSRSHSSRDSRGYSSKDSRGHSSRDSKGHSSRDSRDHSRKDGRDYSNRESMKSSSRDSKKSSSTYSRSYSPSSKHSKSSRYSRSPSSDRDSSRRSYRSKGPRRFSGHDLRNKLSRN